MPKNTSDDHFDVIVIGAGAAGLTSASLLAKEGKKVLLVEKETRIGGLIRPLVYPPYQFDVGARLLMGCNPDGPFGPGAIHALLNHLGVADQCEFIPIQPFVTIRLPGLTFPMWSGRQAFLEGLRQANNVPMSTNRELMQKITRRRNRCENKHNRTVLRIGNRVMK